MYEQLLSRAGLSVREAHVYTTLLNGGEMLASELAKKTGLQRTNTYDVLNTLVGKGVVAYVIRNDKKFFRPAGPEKILDYINTQRRDLEETGEEVKKILPSLRPVVVKTSRPTIEVYEGKEGMKTILEMSIRESVRGAKEIIGISVQQQKCRELAGPYHIRWYNDRERHKIKSRYLMSAEEQILPVKYTQFRQLPADAKNPDEIFIFGDITSQFYFVGGTFTAIVIKNKEITDKYRAYFEFLWRIAKKR